LQIEDAKETVQMISFQIFCGCLESEAETLLDVVLVDHNLLKQNPGFNHLGWVPFCLILHLPEFDL
jgi:hypothetical protein